MKAAHRQVITISEHKVDLRTGAQAHQVGAIVEK
jgi:hypothetical protein